MKCKNCSNEALPGINICYNCAMISFENNEPTLIQQLAPLMQEYQAIWIKIQELINKAVIEKQVDDIIKKEKEKLTCPFCDNPTPHIYSTGGGHCNECKNYWDSKRRKI